MFSYKLNDDAELQLLTPRHAEQIFTLVERNREYLRQWLPWVDDMVSVDDSREARRRGLERFAINGAFDAGIWYREELVGVIGFHQIDWNNRKTAIGYWIAEDFQGKGLMTLACRAMVDHAFESFTLNRVEIKAATLNTRSRAIPERLAFKHEGTLRQSELLYDRYVDMEVYSILFEEWVQQRTDKSSDEG
jgi:ribosomal-protein-serine acetyltransferase